VALTGRLWLDPILAMLVAANILCTGVHLMSRSTAGLMDAALPADQRG
jgi:divalent metal cation (Fe/Co/Zn/Cd) transporter